MARGTGSPLASSTRPVIVARASSVIAALTVWPGSTVTVAEPRRRVTGSPASIVAASSGHAVHAEEAVGVGLDERDPAGDERAGQRLAARVEDHAFDRAGRLEHDADRGGLPREHVSRRPRRAAAVAGSTATTS